MTHRPVVFHPRVEDDLAAILAHYDTFDSALPGRFESRLDDQIDRIEMFPESGAIQFGVYRRVLLKRFPYMAVYIVRDQRIDVVAVIAVRRDPEAIEATVAGRGEE